MSRPLVPVLLAALALGLAACGDDEEEPAQPAGESTPATEAPAAGGEGITVTAQDNVFAPAQLTAKVGDKITWKNGGQVAHNVVAEEGADFKSETMNPGDTFEATLGEAGTISYVCTFHSGMNGTITVE